MNRNSSLLIEIGNVSLRVKSLIPLDVQEHLREFIRRDFNGVPDAVVEVTDRFDPVPPQASFRGEDLLLEYYQLGNTFYAAAKSGLSGPVIVSRYDETLKHFTVCVNEAEYPGVVHTIEKILQLFPMRELLVKNGAWVLHASRIRAGNTAVVFSAPSGTGKSTQAALWKRYENAEIVCNDRTLFQSQGDTVYSFGYPVDGSSPMFRKEPLPVGAIVILRQGPENTVSRLRIPQAVSCLMSQTVADSWNREELLFLRNCWINVAARIPVYQLSCRPDRDSVLCLKKQLQLDGVI